jgi:hypothetical protein
MAGDASRARDPRFPNLAPDVVAGYLDAPSDGSPHLLPTKFGDACRGMYVGCTRRGLVASAPAPTGYLCGAPGGA